MENVMLAKPVYGNWVSRKLILGPAILGLVFLGLALLAPWSIVFSILFFLLAVYFAYAWYCFAPGGRDVQRKIRELLLARLDWNGLGKALDIGCGNAALTIGIAQRYPRARLVGIDDWGQDWDYSRGVCERNAHIEGVGDRTEFQKASAAALPFEDDAFDLVASNLVFHEVHTVKDKRALLREALRVLKPGGRFAFQDPFLWKQIYGQPEALLAEMKSWGLTYVAFEPTCNAPFIPALLKLPFMVGRIGIFYGEK